MLPSTGPEAASIAGVPYSEHRLKNDPEYNRTLGEAYFRKQVETFKGDTEKAAAAYNAGPTAVQRAIARHGEDWLKHLPQETKNYVKSFSGKSSVEVKGEACAEIAIMLPILGVSLLTRFTFFTNESNPYTFSTG
jgi:hypothetical protein